MTGFIRGKKGAVCVFVTMILSTMLLAVTVIGNAAFVRLKWAEADAAFRIGARSVLGEYDIRLKNDYGIFAYKASADRVESKIENYAEVNMNGSFKPFNAEQIEVNAENMEYSLLETEKLKKQLTEAGELAMLTGPKGKKREKPCDAVKYMVNQTTIKTLPSQGKNLKMINLSGLSAESLSLSALAQSAGDSFLENKYIISTFKNRFREIPDRKSFFEYEAEYILTGKTSEAASLKKVKKLLFAFRDPLNTAHIMADPAKMAEAAAYAASIPTPGEPVETAVIVALWSACESENDVKLLLEGKNVAVAKTRAQWALTLEEAVGSLFSAIPKNPPEKSGQSYEDYLNALLFFEDEDTKLIRVLDLIQMNLRGSYNENFLVKDFFTGLTFSAKADGKDYFYEEVY